MKKKLLAVLLGMACIVSAGCGSRQDAKTDVQEKQEDGRKPEDNSTPASTPGDKETDDEKEIKYDEEDFKNLQAVVEKYKNNFDSASCAGDIYSDYNYEWNDNGKLAAIKGWDGLSGEIDLTMFGSLEEFHCMDGDITDIKLPQGLKSLIIRNNKISNLDVSRYSMLEELRCSGNQITKLDLSSNNNLSEVECENNNLDEIILGKGIEYLQCGSNNLTSLDLSIPENLKWACCGDNKLSSLDISPQKQSITIIECNGNQIMSIDVSGCPELNVLNCSDNNISSITMDEETNMLEEVNVKGNPIKSLDLYTASYISKVEKDDACTVNTHDSHDD